MGVVGLCWCVRREAALIARDIKISHSVFAMPFALLGAFLAHRSGSGWVEFAASLVLVVLCMVTARTWAMVVNRLADRDLDARNPRTSGRVFASGRVSVRSGWAWAVASAGGFVASCAGFVWLGNPWPLVLSAPVLAWIGAYSWTKRFTWLCHVWLGASLGATPIAAGLAVEPWSVGLGGGPPTWSIWWLGGMVTAWVAGFDVIYALGDEEFDRGAGLKSLPARLGWSGALWSSRGLHAAAGLLLLGAWWSDERLGALFLAGVVAAWVLLVVEHAVIARRGRAGIPMAFFTINGVVSCVVGGCGIADVLI